MEIGFAGTGKPYLLLLSMYSWHSGPALEMRLSFQMPAIPKKPGNLRLDGAGKPQLSKSNASKKIGLSLGIPAIVGKLTKELRQT